MSFRSSSKLLSLVGLALLACAPAACSSSDEGPSTVASEINRGGRARSAVGGLVARGRERRAERVLCRGVRERADHAAHDRRQARHRPARLPDHRQPEPLRALRERRVVPHGDAPREGAPRSSLAPHGARGQRGLMRLELTESERDRLAFYLVERGARAAATDSNGTVSPGPGVIAVRPSALIVHVIADDMPEPFKARWTVRALFDREAMKAVPAGLYDVRMEVLRTARSLRRRTAARPTRPTTTRYACSIVRSPRS